MVEGTLTHELDAREIPADWPDGFVPIGKSVPYEQPRAAHFHGDDGIVFRLNPQLVREAFANVCGVELVGSGYELRPEVLRGDELASSTFFHGRLMSERAARHVAYQTEGKGTYTITAMDDSGMLQSLTWLAAAGKVDMGRVLIVRGASNYDQQRGGEHGCGVACGVAGRDAFGVSSGARECASGGFAHRGSPGAEFVTRYSPCPPQTQVSKARPGAPKTEGLRCGMTNKKLAAALVFG